jgi:hypothetical protein
MSAYPDGISVGVIGSGGMGALPSVSNRRECSPYTSNSRR